MTDTVEIIVTEEDLPVLVSKAYELSSPQGMGFMHARDGDLDADTRDSILEEGKEHPRNAVSMDYVHGRSCKFRVQRNDDGQPVVRYPWYDHTRHQFDQLIEAMEADRKVRA